MAEAQYLVVDSAAVWRKVNTAEQYVDGGVVRGLVLAEGDWLVTNGTHEQVLSDWQFRSRYVNEDGTPVA
jgi:hypothetical protein